MIFMVILYIEIFFFCENMGLILTIPFQLTYNLNHFIAKIIQLAHNRFPLFYAFNCAVDASNTQLVYLLQ